MKNQRGLLILLAVFVALVAAFGILSSLPNTSDEIIITLTRVFPDLTDLDLAAIRLQNPITGAELTLARTDNGVWVAPDLPQPINAQSAINVARTIVLLAYQRALPVPPDSDLSDYGFNPDGVLNIQFVTTSDETHFIAVGSLNTLRAEYYAIADDRPDIFLLDRPAVDYLLLTAQQPPTNE